MQRWRQKIVLIVAVATIIGHNCLPHHHHDAIESVAHHLNHDEDHDRQTGHHDHEQDTEDDHNLFSFAQLDEDFVPVKSQKVNIDLPILYLLTPVITYQMDQLKEQSKNHFGYYREFPPPRNYLSNLFSRPPPSC
jgi:hypothetical protein